MENYDEILIVIKKWFDESLKISINIPDDFDDGRYYLELLKQCIDLDIPNIKNQNYEKIECTLNEFYGFQTNCVVDYYEFLYSPEIENIISLCILCIVFCQKYKQIPHLSQDDFKRLIILTSPICHYLNTKELPTVNSFHKAIGKATERELDDISLSSKSLEELIKSNANNHKSDTRHNGSDEDISTSSNLPSIISDSSYRMHLSHDVHNDSISDAGTNDRSKESLRRKYKLQINNKARRNQNLFFSPAFRRSVNSPKLNESRKLEQRKLKNLEFDNHNLKQEVCHLTDEIGKLEESHKKLNLDLSKLKSENRKLLDEIDCFNSKVEENSMICLRKDKEAEKLKKDLEATRKSNTEKLDEIKQLGHSNHKLRQDIHDLNIKLKTKASQCEESMKIELDISQEKRVIENENDKLRETIDELTKQVKDYRDMKYHIVNRETLSESPVSTIELGESLDIINQFKLAEIKDEYERKKRMFEEEIKSLKSEIDTEKSNYKSLETDHQMAVIKLTETSQQLKQYNVEFTKLEEEIKDLKEQNSGLLENDTKISEKSVWNIEDTNLDKVVEILKILLSHKEFSGEDKQRLLKLSAEYLGVENSGSERNHDLCQHEIMTMYQKLKTCKEELKEKNLHLDEMNNALYDCEHQMAVMKDELGIAQSTNQEMNRLWQNQKSKTDETEFKLKKTLFAVEEERKEVNVQNANLKKELLTREKELQKSNQEFNILRSRYDDSLHALHNMAKDCEDYEQVIMEVTAKQSIVYRNVSCQTDNPYDLYRNGNSGQNTKMGNGVEKGNNYRPGLLREPFIENYSRELPFSNRNTDVSSVNRFMRSSAKPTYPSYSPMYRNEISSDRSIQDREALLVSPKFPRQNNTPHKISGHRYHEYDQYPLTNTRPLDPKWVSDDKPYNVTPQRNSTAKGRKAGYPVNSPAVKPARLNQMITRNLQQPEHLKSSYPVETQAVEQDYLAHCLMNEIDVTDSDVVEMDPPETTVRQHSARNYIHVDPMNLRPNLNNQAFYNYNENAFSDELIKCSNFNGNPSRNMVLSARSNNSTTPRNDIFKRPFAANLTTQKPVGANRDSDRENAVPPHDSNNMDLYSDRESNSSASIKFEINNTPKRKIRGIPRGSKVQMPRM